jgi:hypothetical protein
MHDELNNDQQSRSTEERNPSIYCPICSTRLQGQRCKLVCEKCGYYMSCADYY